MSKLKVDEIRSADRSISSSANITLADDGKVGIGATSPAANLHIHTETDATDEGTNAVLTLGSNTTGKMRMYFGVNDANNYTYIGSVESGTAYRNLLLQPNGGNVGVGTTSPDMPFHVYSSANSLMHIQSSDQDALFKLSDTGGHFQINTANNNTSLGTNGRGEMMRFSGTTGIVFNEDGLNQTFRVESDNNANALTMDGSSGIWGIGTSYGTYALKIDGVGNSGLFTGGVVSCGSLDNRSDARLKENITPLGDSLNTLNQLRPVTFNLTKDVFAGEDFAGFIAQEVKTVFPVAVRGDENETEDVLNEDGEVTQKPVYMSIKMMEMIALLTKSIQELSAKVTALENK